ncbi:FYVE-domain-containing protein [Mycena olivaceomarginata]|nr:FYVE-domain-containing protein [Mycena olivaceomarginata]
MDRRRSARTAGRVDPAEFEFHVGEFRQVTARPNELLAVLLPKKMWEADRSAAYCENFSCRVPFSVWERRHHCRKCGGVFCQPCSSRTTTLLDTTHLSFLHAPRNTPLNEFESPTFPIIEARICDDCFDQIHDLRSPDLVPHSPAPSRVPTPSWHPQSPSSAPPPPPPLPQPRRLSLLQPSFPPVGISRTHPSSLIHTNPHRRGSMRRPCLRGVPLALESEEVRSYGELDAYPLPRPSLLCKASGGGRWEPKPHTVDPELCVPSIGGKAPFELEMEREEAEERRRRSNPLTHNTDFQYRFPPTCDPEP